MSGSYSDDLLLEKNITFLQIHRSKLIAPYVMVHEEDYLGLEHATILATNNTFLSGINYITLHYGHLYLKRVQRSGLIGPYLRYPTYSAQLLSAFQDYLCKLKWQEVVSNINDYLIRRATLWTDRYITI